MARDLKTCIDQLVGDERLRSHMDDAYAAIWLHAGGEHLRQTARDGGDLELACRIVRDAIRQVNDALAVAQMAVTSV